jgi:adenylyltransferase/sulfurtransferase
MALTPDQYRRYQRHITLPELGMAGQERLLAAKALIVGAGGLGCPAAIYLAAAGVGTIGLVDFDVVDESNLQRQILFAAADVGKAKVDVAAQRLQAANPDVDVQKHNTRLEAANAYALIAGYDVVLDGTDNFPARYLVNDACVMAGKPNVHGSIYRFEGQVSVFGMPDSPCYRCLFPEPPPLEAVQSCAQAGVLGVLPGVIATLQATEAIKFITGIGKLLTGRLLTFDALSMTYKELQVPRQQDCPLCGDSPTITELQDLQLSCPATATTQETDTMDEITVTELHQLMQSDQPPVLLDVREQHEYDFAHIEGATLLPLSTLMERHSELEPYRDHLIVAHCHHGMRSAQAIGFLQTQGYTNMKNLAGGIDAWSVEVDENVPIY